MFPRSMLLIFCDGYKAYPTHAWLEMYSLVADSMFVSTPAPIGITEFGTDSFQDVSLLRHMGSQVGHRLGTPNPDSHRYRYMASV